jgi:hypothetical protein
MAMRELSCARCDRRVPSDSAELTAWQTGAQFSRGDLPADEPTVQMLVCPDCQAELRSDEYDDAAQD